MDAYGQEDGGEPRLDHRARLFQSGGALKTGIWKFDAKNLAAPGGLAIEINDTWQLSAGSSGIGCTEVSYYDGMLYYNTPRAVWRWEFPEPARPEKVFELDRDDPSQIWYLHVADGKVYYETAHYANDYREHREFVFDEGFQKVKHSIAVTSDVLKLKVGGSPKGDFLRAAAPGTMTLSSSDPEVCALEPIVAGKSYQLRPKKAGQAVVTITAAETDHYLPGTKTVTINVTDDSAPVEMFTVRYDLGYAGAQNPAPAQVASGGKVPRPDDPVRAGYVFKGWCNGDALYDFESPVRGNLTLTAAWEQEPAPAP